MRILLATLNAKYIHSSLSLRYLKKITEAFSSAEISMEEFTLNEPLLRIVDKIYLYQANIAAFSCYIWNISQILKIASILKKIQPDLKIILGGPEASANAEYLSLKPEIDLIVKGEGEEAWKLLSERGFEINKLNLKQPKILSLPLPKDDLSFIPFPYEENDNFTDRLIYYETSRGCPFNCSFCISSLSKGIRFAPLFKVKNEIAKLVSKNTKNLKFVDRTFNVEQSRTFNLWEYFLSLGGQTKFYFEIIAQHLTPKELDFLTSVPPAKFQFEIGVQTIHSEINRLCNRHQNWEQLKDNILFLKQNTNINLHLDLIAGLPTETDLSFAQSFDETHNLFPDELQLGFLKFLPGTPIRREASKYGYLFLEDPPYEILASNSFGYQDLLKWHDIEELIDYYFNSHLADIAIFWLIKKVFFSPTAFYQILRTYFRSQGLFDAKHGRKELLSILSSFCQSISIADYPDFLQILKFEWLKLDKSGHYPSWCPPKAISLEEKKYWKEKISNSDFRKRYLPLLQEETKERLLRRGEVEKFSLNPLTFEKKIVYVYYFYGQKKEKATAFLLPEMN